MATEELDQIEAGGGEPNGGESILAPDAAGDMAELERLIAADESATQADKSAVRGRDERGRYLDEAGTNKGTRPPQRATPEEIRATRKPAEAKAEAGDGSGTSAAKDKPAGEGSPSPQPSPPGEGEKAAGDGKATGNTNGSAYAKEMARRDASWKALNAEKEALAKEREAWKSEMELKEKAVTAQARSLGRQPTYKGFTADQLAAGAKQYEAKAAQMEAAFDYDGAAQQRELAQAAAARAEELRVKQPFSPDQSWAALKADMPEVLQVGSAMNVELRRLIGEQPQIMEHPHGPYRAVLHVGRKMLAGLEAEVQKHRAEAAKVPELSRQLQTLTQRIKELEEQTSLPDDGGGADNRGRGPRDFSQLSTTEMEAHLSREMAGQVG